MKPVRLRGYSAELGCATIQVVAYRAQCSCGWKGQAQASVRAARVLARAHSGVNAV